MLLIVLLLALTVGLVNARVEMSQPFIDKDGTVFIDVKADTRWAMQWSKNLKTWEVVFQGGVPGKWLFFDLFWSSKEPLGFYRVVEVKL